MAANVTVTNAVEGSLVVERVDDRYDLWRVRFRAATAEDATIRLAASPACGAAGAMCTADGRRVLAAEATVYKPLTATFADVPESHDGATAFTVRIELSAPLHGGAADVAANVTAANGTRGAVARVDGRYDLWEVAVTPSGDDAVTIRLAASPACDAAGAMCTIDGRRAPAAETTVRRGVTATFVEVPGAHDGSAAFAVRIELSAPLAAATADVAANVTAANGTRGAVARVDGRYDLWEVAVTPTGEDTVTVRLAASPACDAAGAMCAADGRRALAAETTVPHGDLVGVDMACAENHDGAGSDDEFTSYIELTTALAPSTANVAENVRVSNADIVRVLPDERLEGWAVLMHPTTNETVTLRLVASPACDAAGAMCTADGALVPAARCTTPLNPDSRNAPEDGTVTATFADVPAAHDGATAFAVRIELSAALDKSTADVAANVSAANGARGAVTRVDGRYDLWEVNVTPSGDDAVTVALAASPECAEPGAMCAKDGARVTAAETAVPGPAAAFSAADAAAAEDAGGLAFEVTLEPAAGAAASVDYATADGTATAGDDYAAASGTLDFAAGETSKTVAVAVAADAAVEDDETLTLTLSNAAGAAIADGAATGTIENDDDAPRPKLSVSDASGPEGGAASFAVTLDAEPAGTVSTFYSTAGGTATEYEDYAGTSGELVFAAGETEKTVDVALLDDAEPEPDETFRLELLVATGASFADPTGIGTIVDDDAPAGELTATFTAVPAGHDGTRFAVGLDFSEEVEDLGHAWVRDTLVAAEGGAVARAARRSPPANAGWRLEIEPDAPGADVAVSMADGASVPDGRAVAPGAPATVPGQSLSAADARAAEGGAASFAVTLDRGATGAVTVDYATADGTATAGEDYAAASGTLTFAPGASSRTVDVAALDDAEAEFDETFALTLSNASGAGLADATATGTVEDDDAPSARLRAAPAEHGGADRAFEAGLEFSEEIAGIGYAWVRDTLATATDGTVEKAARANASPPENRAWTLTVAPASSADVVLGLAAGLALPDGTPLRVGEAVTVRGPAPTGSSVDGAALTLVWPAPRDGFGAASGSDYAVAVNGAPRAVASAVIAGRRALLVLSAPAAADDAVTVGYVGSAMHPLADAAGGVRSAPWDGVAVDNATGTESAKAAQETAPAHAAQRLGAAPMDAARLDASGLGLADLSALAPFGALVRLDLSDNALADLRGIGAHGSLRELDLSGNRIADAGPLRALHALERLDLSGNRVADIAPLAGLPALAVLVLDGNAVADLGPLTHLAALEHLGLAGNAVADVAPLQDLPRLRRLDLGGNPVSDLSPLGDVGSLEWLALPGEPAAAADALARLTGLRWTWPGRAR